MSDRVRVGITLPSFVDDPETALEVARVADETGIDGVFVYDHLFRRGKDGSRRPALEVSALLGIVATMTKRVSIGTLVLRASLRPPATTESIVATAARIAPGRTIVGVGAGDSESREENDTFGLDFASMSARLTRLGDTVRAIRDRGAPIWVGGIAKEVRGIAAREADGWNAWGLTPERFAEHAAEVTSAASHSPFECSWSGLVVADDTDQHAEARADTLGSPKNTIVGGPETIARAFRALHEMGASWVIVGAVDAANPRTAHVLGEHVVPLLV